MGQNCKTVPPTQIAHPASAPCVRARGSTCAHKDTRRAAKKGAKAAVSRDGPWSHGRIRRSETAAPGMASSLLRGSVPVPLKPAARAERRRIGFQWRDAHSLSSRFGLPGSQPRPTGIATPVAQASRLANAGRRATGRVPRHRHSRGASLQACECGAWSHRPSSQAPPLPWRKPPGLRMRVVEPQAEFPGTPPNAAGPTVSGGPRWSARHQAAGRAAAASPGTPWLCPRLAEAAGAMDGPAAGKVKTARSRRSRRRTGRTDRCCGRRAAAWRPCPASTSHTAARGG